MSDVGCGTAPRAVFSVPEAGMSDFGCGTAAARCVLRTHVGIARGPA